MLYTIKKKYIETKASSDKVANAIINNPICVIELKINNFFKRFCFKAFIVPQIIDNDPVK
jgi:hypothetical protein